MRDYFAALFPEGVTSGNTGNTPLKPSKIAINDEEKFVTTLIPEVVTNGNAYLDLLPLLPLINHVVETPQTSKIALLPVLPLVTTQNNEEFIYSYEERAAIMEFDGGLSRSEAERLAKIDVETNLNGGRNHEPTN